MASWWQKFDEDANDHVDFSEFVNRYPSMVRDSIAAQKVWFQRSLTEISRIGPPCLAHVFLNNSICVLLDWTMVVNTCWQLSAMDSWKRTVQDYYSGKFLDLHKPPKTLQTFANVAGYPEPNLWIGSTFGPRQFWRDTAENIFSSKCRTTFDLGGILALYSSGFLCKVLRSR